MKKTKTKKESALEIEKPKAQIVFIPRPEGSPYEQ
jgi:hypothetical protein